VFDRRTANGSVGSLDATGCIETSADVVIFDGVIKVKGRPNLTSSISVFTGVFNFCTGETLSFAEGDLSDLPDSQLHIDNQLKSGRVEATVTVFDFSGTSSFPVSVNFTWAGTGPIQTVSHDISKQRVYQFFYSYSRTQSDQRSATLSGNVALPQATLVATPDNSFATLGSFKQQQINIEK